MKYLLKYPIRIVWTTCVLVWAIILIIVSLIWSLKVTDYFKDQLWYILFDEDIYIWWSIHNKNYDSIFYWMIDKPSK